MRWLRFQDRHGRIRSKRTLLGALLLLQASVMVLGGLLAIDLVRGNFERHLDREATRASRGFAERIGHDLTDDPRLRAAMLGADTGELDAWARTVNVRRDGIVAIIDADGRVIAGSGPCGSSLRPGTRALLPHAPDAAPRSAYTPVAVHLDGADAEFPAVALPFSGRPVVAVSRPVAQGPRLLVHLPQPGLALVARSVVRDVLVAAASLGLLLLAVTAAISLFILTRYESTLECVNHELEAEARARVAQSLATRDALIFGLAKLADCRDTDTGGHLERIGAYTTILAEHLRARHPEIDDAWIARLRLASSLHDVGKVGIPDAILLKPGRLEPAERAVMQQHPVIGADTLMAIRRRLGTDDFLDMGIEVTLQHHERWDGTGYPFALAGEEISIAARIVALADFYDAVTSERVYKSAMSHAEARSLVAELRGTHFDPDVADAFEANHERFDDVRRRLQPAPGEGVPHLIDMVRRLDNGGGERAAA